MANEVEASELVVAKEDFTNEEASHGESSSAGGVSVCDGAGDSAETVKEVKLGLETETGVMSGTYEKHDLELTGTKETVTEKVTELKEPLTLTEGNLEIMEKRDSETVREETKESVMETKSEFISGSVVSDEEKLADEPIAGSESDPSDKPTETGDMKPVNESVAGSEPVSSDKPVTTGEEQPADEPVTETESVPCDRPVTTDKEKSVNESMAGSEPVSSDKLVTTIEEKSANESIAESEPVSSDKPVATIEEKSAVESITETESVPCDKPITIGEEEPAVESVAEVESIPSDKHIVNGGPKPADELPAETEAVLGDELIPDDASTPGLEPKACDEEIPESEQVPSDKPEPADGVEVYDELSPGFEPEPADEAEVDDELSPGFEPEPSDEQIPGPEEEADSEEEEKEVVQDEENNEENIEKPLDDDQDRRNPQYIPKGGAFYEHDNRTSLEDVENKDPQDNEKKKKSWKESKDSEKWLHDCYDESEQLPKSTAEIIETYGYDIRRDDAPPRARRRRKYGRGPDKYERSWEDEQAYQIKQTNIGRRGRRKPFGKEEFPPLPNQKFESSVSKPVHKSSIRKKEEVGPKSVNVKLNGNEKPPTTSQTGRPSYSATHNNLHSFNSNRKSYSTPSKKLNDSDIKPFRNDDSKWKTPFRHGRQDDFPKPIKMQSVRHTEPPFKRSVEMNKNSAKEPQISHITDGINQMTFINQKQTDMRDVRLKANGPEENKISEPEVDNPANRQNPKRYSKIRKGFTGIFPPEEVPELDQSEIHKLQEEQQKSQHLNMTQPLNMQNVMKRYAGTYGNLSNCVSDFVPGSSSYLQARPIISAIPQQALSPQGIHQQALSPQGIPQQALSPQVPGLPTIELQQNPLAQPNFIPQPMYVDAHFTSDVMGPFSGYSPYSGNQTGDVYQPPRGITYYNTESQTTGQKRPPPRRQNAAIPIVRPPE